VSLAKKKNEGDRPPYYDSLRLHKKKIGGTTPGEISCIMVAQEEEQVFHRGRRRKKGKRAAHPPEEERDSSREKEKGEKEKRSPRSSP